MHLVFSSHRSGSKSFCDKLTTEVSARYRGEWFNPDSGEDWVTRYRRCRGTYTRNFLLNIMVPHLPKYFASNGKVLKEADALLTLGTSAYFTSRVNFDAACRSYCVAKATNMWSDQNTWEGVKEINYKQSQWEEDVRFMKKTTILLAKLYHHVKSYDIHSEVSYLEDCEKIGSRSGIKIEHKPFAHRKYKFVITDGEMAPAELEVVKLFESSKFTEQCCEEYI